MKIIDHSGGKAYTIKPPLSASATFVRIPLDGFGVTLELDRRDLLQLTGMMEQIQRDNGTRAIE